MEKIRSGFAIVSGVICEDLQNNSVNITLDDNYTLVCESYEISRGNKIVEVNALSRNSTVLFGGVGAFYIKATGEVFLNDGSDFIAVINEISSRKEPFTLNISGRSFENILLKSYSAEIDKFGTRAVCSLVFVEILEG